MEAGTRPTATAIATAKSAATTPPTASSARTATGTPAATASRARTSTGARCASPPMASAPSASMGTSWTIPRAIAASGECGRPAALQQAVRRPSPPVAPRVAPLRRCSYPTVPKC
eukprot:TRINITY_DN3437_c0_g1_i1.p1 TRINITY_DN3437_c0_g1~~TRINITY_DN3437_c0_g1_i1.p1  ORF type:complete len:115 (-),score=1.78 TRINITY_DN3437_c0_g1_i1:83-427(-)